MSEDARSSKAKKVYYVSNPDSDDIEDYPRNPYKPHPSPDYHRPTPRSPEHLLPTLNVAAPLYQHSHQPPLSPASTGSPSTSTPPPTTPGHAQSASVDLQPRIESPSKPLPTPDSSSTVSYADFRSHVENPPQSTKSRFFPTWRAFGARPKVPNENKSSRPSPTAAPPDPVTTPSNPSSSTPPEKVIFVTSDAERYVTVDISSAKSALQIRELIFTKLGFFNEDEQHPYSIYRTEIGSHAIGEALSNDHLYTLCRDHGDAKGNLKFYVSQFGYKPVPQLPSNTLPLRVRRRSRSRNGSISSASENMPMEVGYEADGENLPPSRPSQSQGTITISEHPPSPHRRPSLPHPLPGSSHIHPVEQPSQPTSSSQSRPWRKDDKYGYTPLPPIPVPPPTLSPNRPMFTSKEDMHSLSTQERQIHTRSASDVANEQKSALKATDPQTQMGSSLRPPRSGENPSAAKLPPQPSRENLWERSPRRPYDEDEDSYEIVMAPTRPADELERISPLARTSRTNRPKPQPTSPFSQRHNVYTSSRVTPSASTNTLPLHSEPRPSVHPQQRAGRWPLPASVFVNWKGEEGSNRNKVSHASTSGASASSWQGSKMSRSSTKSMDNLRSPNHSNSRRNAPPQLPGLTRPQTSSSPYSPISISSSNLSISGTPKSYEPPRTGMRPLPVQGSHHTPSSSDHYSNSSSHYASRPGLYSSSSTFGEPYPRPQSAAGEAGNSPSSSRRMQSPTYLNSGESHRSPRAISPSRPFYPPIPGPRPRPNNHRRSDRSDRSSASGPETINTSPPHTPVSPQSPRYESSENGFPTAEPSPPSSPDTGTYVGANGTDLTLKPEEQAALKKMLNVVDNATIVHKSAAPQTRSISPPPALENNPSMSSYYADDDDDDFGTGGTWIVRPDALQPANKPPLTVHIENPTNPPSPEPENSSRQATARPPVPPKDQQPPSSYRPPALAARLLSSGGRPESTFIDPEGDNWARPPPENIYDQLEKFFPTHDLDKPVIEATASGDTSPTSSAPPAGMIPPPVPVQDEKAKVRAKKSIRIVAQEHKKKIDRTSRTADHAAYADNMKRKRSTKLWGSRLEEVTTAQARSASSSSLPDSPSNGPGPTTFKWVRGELIGKGTYGRVYLALNATTGEMIAVKQVELPQTASDKNDSRQHTVVQALKMESETLRDLDHPHIVQYLGFEETPANLSIFLEYVPGGSVGSCLHKHGRFNDNVTRSFTAQILSGLEYLHSKGILHRDLKADNILVEMSGTCKISDFGISKRTEDLHGGAFTAMQGTVFWMAPEVINTQGKGYNFKIDIWSVGCVVLEMWAGIRPWSGEEMVAVMFKLYQSKQPPPVPEDITPLLPEADDFRLKCFAINPEDRPSAAELRKHPYLILPPDWVFTEFT
ncbi:Pkinase-domain-containing protein [Agrocybe pediades]|nr:Pkinase-domain-containing protein [Agrocybe pediades]